MGRRSPDSPDVAEYHDKIDKYRDSRHRSPSMSEKRRYEKSYSPVPIKSRRPRRSRSYESPDRRRGRKHQHENPPPSRCVGIFGMNIYTRESQIRDLFSKFGQIRRINMITCSQTGRSRGFGFVYYHNLDDAITAKEQTNGMEIDDRRIRVDFSITDRAHTPTPGTYMGSRYDSRYRQRGSTDYDRRRRHNDRRRSYSRSKSRSRSNDRSKHRSSKRHRYNGRSHSRSD